MDLSPAWVRATPPKAVPSGNANPDHSPHYRYRLGGNRNWIFGLTPAHPPENPVGTWRIYGVGEGLAALQVAHIVEDQHGYLWFATCTNGVSRCSGGCHHLSAYRQMPVPEQENATPWDTMGCASVHMVELRGIEPSE